MGVIKRRWTLGLPWVRTNVAQGPELGVGPLGGREQVWLL